MGAPGIKLVETGDLPDYPPDLIDARMTSDYFTVFWHDRWLNSELHLTAPLDVQGAALNLFFVARKQNPVGSLPDNDKMLAKLLHVDLSLWQELRGRAVSPLRNWSRYRAGEKIVLGHPVVIAVAQDALNRREAREAANNEKATTMRLNRLREAMLGIKCAKAVVRDDVLVERIDAWLLEHHKGARRMPRFEASLNAALRHAEREGWFRTHN